MKKTAVWLVGLLLLLTIPGIVGCRPGPAAPGPAGGQDVVVVTDAGKLAMLWDNYIYDGITTVLNAEFTNPAEMEEQHFLVSYALRKMTRAAAGAAETCDAVFREIDIPAAAAVEAEIEKYFGLKTQVSLREEIARYYGIEPGDTTVTVNIGHLSYGTENPWGIVMDKVTYDPAGKEYAVALNNIANRKTGRVGRIMHVVLKEREDGSLYYRSVRYEYPETELVEITGDYTVLDPADFGAKSEVYSMPIDVRGSAVGGRLLLRANRRENENDPSLVTNSTFSVYDPSAKRVISSLVLPQTPEKRLSGVRILPGQLIFKLNDGFFSTDLALKRQGNGTTSLPEPIRAVLGDRDFTAGYDVSADRSQIVYTDKTGLHLYDLRMGESRRLASHVPVNSELFDMAYIMAPQFVAGDAAVIAKLSGYEGYYGLMTIDLADPAAEPRIVREINILDSLDCTNVMHPVPNLRFRTAEGTVPDFGIEMMDLAKAGDPAAGRQPNAAEIEFADEHQKRLLESVEQHPLYNNRYLAYVAEGYEPGMQPEEVVYRVVRIDLATLRAETVLKVKAGVPYLLALTGDGRVMLSYHFEREAGLVITGK